MIRLTILGEPASKANSREIVMIGGRPSVIKSKKALAYERDALRQIPPAARQQLQGEVAVTMRIFYATERPDLDESLILDILQDRYKTEKTPETHTRYSDGTQTMTPEKRRRVLVQKGVYVNDRQVREKHIYHAIDRRNPRTEIEVAPVQADLLGAVA